MKKTFKILLFISMIAIFTSCEDKKDVVVFGETEWYKSWLWKKYEPVIMERILKLRRYASQRLLLLELSDGGR